MISKCSTYCIHQCLYFYIPIIIIVVIVITNTPPLLKILINKCYPVKYVYASKCTMYSNLVCIFTFSHLLTYRNKVQIATMYVFWVLFVKYNDFYFQSDIFICNMNLLSPKLTYMSLNLYTCDFVKAYASIYMIWCILSHQ